MASASASGAVSRRGGWAGAASNGLAWSLASATRHNTGMPRWVASASTAQVSASAPPASSTIQAEGVRLNNLSVAGAGVNAAQARATCASRPSSGAALSGPATDCRASAHQASRCAGWTAAAPRASVCAACSTSPTAWAWACGSRARQSRRAATWASSWAATRRSTATSPLRLPCAAPGAGPNVAASVRTVSIRGIQPPSPAKALRAGGSNSTKGSSRTASCGASARSASQERVASALASHKPSGARSWFR